MASWSVAVKAGVAVVTFARPPRSVASLAAMKELADALDGLKARTEEVTVVLLSGEGEGSFIADCDREELDHLASEEQVEDDAALDGWCRALSSLESMPQPTVAAIDGWIGSGGCATALACTLRLGSDRAQLGPFETNLGIVGSDSTERLVRLVGPAVTAELVLSGRVIHAEEARSRGLLNDVLPGDGFDDLARQWCQRIAERPAAMVFRDKRVVDDASWLTRDEVIRIGPDVFIEPPPKLAVPDDEA